VSWVVLACSLPGEAERLAGVSPGNDIDIRDVAPINFGDVSDV
jgi:hypothetical protein